MLHPPIAGTGTSGTPAEQITHPFSTRRVSEASRLGPKALINLKRVKGIEPSTRSLGRFRIRGRISSSKSVETAEATKVGAPLQRTEMKGRSKRERDAITTYSKLMALPPKPFVGGLTAI
jgi:hypothetical protein